MATMVLVPGAWLGGWVWSRVTPLLEKNGCRSYPVTLTGMGERVHLASEQHGIETAIQDVLNLIQYNDLDDFVLVGHSFAGKVVAAVADRTRRRVGMILYLDAFRPSKGVRKPQGGFSDEFPVEGWKIPFPEMVFDGIAKDVRGPDADWLRSKATIWPVRYSREPVTLSERFDSVRSTYILCTGGGDDIEQIRKEPLDGPSKIIESGHYPMITKPEELVEDMLHLTA